MGLIICHKTTTDLTSYFPIITGLFAFSAALLAQIIAHRFAISRDNNKFNKEVLQKLYLPILFDIYMYLDISTPRRRSAEIKYELRDEEPIGEVGEKIVNHIANNIMYASNNLINSYHDLKTTSYKTDTSDGYANKKAILRLFWTFLEELNELNKKQNFFFDDKLSKYQWFYLVLIYLYSFRPEDANSIMGYKEDLRNLTSQNYTLFKINIKSISMDKKMALKYILLLSYKKFIGPFYFGDKE